jgi:thymidylate kinase
MYINFIGSPCSGKTTSAAKLFADLKELGLEVEFISEYARYYIANSRLQFKAINKSFKLDDNDQYHIFHKQLEIETIMSEASKDAIVISDTSVWNSCLYMTEKYLKDFLNTTEYKQAINRYENEKGLTIICSPVERPYSPDSNRVHSKEESLKIHYNIRHTLEELIPNNKIPMIFGSVEDRHKTLMKLVFEKIY